jgi:hypothetical protein
VPQAEERPRKGSLCPEAVRLLWGGLDDGFDALQCEESQLLLNTLIIDFFSLYFESQHPTGRKPPHWKWNGQPRDSFAT